MYIADGKNREVDFLGQAAVLLLSFTCVFPIDCPDTAAKTKAKWFYIF